MTDVAHFVTEKFGISINKNSVSWTVPYTSSPLFNHLEKPPIFMLSCGHDFCYDCLLGAFSNNNSCPECRAVQSVEHIDQLNRNRRLEKAVLSLKTTKTVERRAEEEDYSALILRNELLATMWHVS